MALELDSLDDGSRDEYREVDWVPAVALSTGGWFSFVNKASAAREMTPLAGCADPALLDVPIVKDLPEPDWP